VTEALTYVHEVAKVAHCGLSPENVFVTRWGAWKLAGFFFAEPIVKSNGEVTDANVVFVQPLYRNYIHTSRPGSKTSAGPQPVPVPGSCQTWTFPRQKASPITTVHRHATCFR